MSFALSTPKGFCSWFRLWGVGGWGGDLVFVRLRLLIKTSLCSKVLLPVLMRIKKPKSVCVVKKPKGVSVCENAQVLVGVKDVWVRVCVCVCVQYLCIGVCFHVHVCVYRHYCLCASLAEHPGQGEGLILCGLKRINFVLTLAGCGLHPYPPLFSFPGARQRRRQASGDGEDERERECRREGEGGGAGSRDSKKCHFRKGLYSLFLTISPFYELALLRELFKYVCCVSR